MSGDPKERGTDRDEQTAASLRDAVRQVIAVIICLPTIPFLWVASKVAPRG